MIGPIAAVRLFVFDLKSAIDFYTDVLGLKSSSRSEGHAAFDVGGCDLIVEAADPDDDEDCALVGRFLGVSFRVEDIERVYRDLSACGVSFDGAPARQVWGGILAHVKDPDGNVLTLVQYP